MNDDINSLSHSKWRCKYHIVFAPKYRRQVIYGDIRKDIGVILRKLCEQKNEEIIEAELCPEHIHMLVSIPPNLSVAQFVGYLKGKSSVLIYEKFGEMKYKYRNREFWCRGYYVDTVGKNTKAIAEYIKHQLDEDKHANLKYKYGNRHFWCRGYYVDTVGKNEKKIAEYIREQLQSDMMEDQISLKEFVDPFTGEKNKKA